MGSARAGGSLLPDQLEAVHLRVVGDPRVAVDDPAVLRDRPGDRHVEPVVRVLDDFDRARAKRACVRDAARGRTIVELWRRAELDGPPVCDLVGEVRRARDLGPAADRTGVVDGNCIPVSYTHLT